MGFMDRFLKRRDTGSEQPKRQTAEIAVGADDDKNVSMTFNDRNIAFTSAISGYDYDSI